MNAPAKPLSNKVYFRRAYQWGLKSAACWLFFWAMGFSEFSDIVIGMTGWLAFLLLSASAVFGGVAALYAVVNALIPILGFLFRSRLSFLVSLLVFVILMGILGIFIGG